jgi:hypothetical protein
VGELKKEIHGGFKVISMDYDILVTPSEEARICLNCTSKRCHPDKCERYLSEKKRIKREKGKFKGEEND